MNKQNCIKRISKARTVSITIRATKDQSEFMKKENLSPTGIFNEALKDLGYKGE